MNPNPIPVVAASYPASPPILFFVQPQISPYHPPQRGEKSGHSLHRPRRWSQRAPCRRRRSPRRRRRRTARGGMRRSRRLLVQFVDLGVHVLESLLLVFRNVSVGVDGEALERLRFRQAFDEQFLRGWNEDERL